jgi:hypothetical protein
MGPPLARESLPSAAAVIIATTPAEQKQHGENHDDDPNGFHDLTPLGENKASSGPEYSERKKKTTCPNTLRCSNTSVYSLTDHPARPSCPLPSHPKSLKSILEAELLSTTAIVWC